MKRIFAVLLLFFVLPLRAETVDSVPNPLRTKRSWVGDNANVIDAQSEYQTNRAIENFKRQTGGEIAVVTIQDTNGESPKQFATALFNRWGIGQRNKDNGVLILLVMGKRRLEIETGRGTSRILPNNKVAEIRDEYAIPAFKRGDFGGGVFATTNAIIQAMSATSAASKKSRTAPLISKSDKPNSTRRPYSAPNSNSNKAPYNSNNSAAPTYFKPSQTNSSGPFDVIIGLLILALFPIGIGVLIWGGIAILKQFSTRKCTMCGRVMRRLGENEEDVFLSSDQQFEERMGGLDYKVWKCENCGVCHIERSARWASKVKDCPRCHHCTVKVHSETVQQATYSSTGLRETTSRCEYPNCGHQTRTSETLPMLVHSTSSSSDSSWSSSSSSSSDFSSSSSDFGGGSSDGGGAGGDW